MKGKNSQKKKKSGIIWLYIPIIALLFSLGIIVLSAFGVFREEEPVWQGFPMINRLDKKPVETDVVGAINEKEAEEFINANTPLETEPAVPEIPQIPVIYPTVVGEAGDHILKETNITADAYFSDTLFIGDSRMVGLGMTCKDYGATFYAGVGLSVSQLDTKEVIKIDNDTTLTVMDAIRNDERNYKRIYMMFGLNELGWSYPSVFIRAYKTAIEQISELCPDAEFCIISVMPISAETKVSIYQGPEANARIREYNSLLLELASEKNCWYLDTYSYFSDEFGNLPSECASDGIHMYSKQNLKLIDYISRHLFAT